MSAPRVVAVVGPTATGKSDLALDLADRLGGPDAAEVVNADSMQVYRGMDIGTAKLAPEERRGVVHHLLDVWPVTYAVTVADYQAHARAAVDDVRARGKVPLLVGGSGLYVQAVLDDLRFPGTDAAVRARWEARLAERGAEALHAELARRDPEAAGRILPTNGRRLVRALEVVELTGGPFVAALPAGGARPAYDAVLVGLRRDDLATRIDTRVERMWAAGLVDEVRRLRDDEGLERGRTAARALGYAQALQQLRGELTEAEAIERTASATRRFARRQRTWFARDPRVRWYDAAEPGLPDAVLRSIGA